jgi:hypothetical protein
MPEQNIIHNVWIPLVQRDLVAQLRAIICELTYREKIETVQLLLYQAGKRSGSSIKVLVPKTLPLDTKIHTVFAIAEHLSPHTLVELAIEFLEEVIYENQEQEG